MTTTAKSTSEAVGYKQQYRTLKRRFKFLVYENECYQEELRNLQRKLLKLSRDKNFLLDRLLQFEKVSDSSDDSDVPGESNESTEVKKQSKSKEGSKKKRPKPEKPSGDSSTDTTTTPTKPSSSKSRKRPPRPRPSTTSSAVSISVDGGQTNVDMSLMNPVVVLDQNFVSVSMAAEAAGGVLMDGMSSAVDISHL